MYRNDCVIYEEACVTIGIYILFSLFLSGFGTPPAVNGVIFLGERGRVKRVDILHCCIGKHAPCSTPHYNHPY